MKQLETDVVVVAAGLSGLAASVAAAESGARVITYTVVMAMDETTINLLYIYDKADRDSVSATEIEELLRKNGLR